MDCWTDEAGAPLTDDEIAAVVRARPLLAWLIVGHRGDDIELCPAGARVTWRAEDGPGRVTVARSVIAAASDGSLTWGPEGQPDRDPPVWDAGGRAPDLR